MTPDLTLDNNAIKIRIRLITDIDYVTIAKPLNDLLIGNLPTKKKKWNKSVNPNNTWEWLESQNTAFIRLKEALISPPVLGFEVSVDSSSEGIGGVIYQIQNGVKQVLAFARFRTKSLGVDNLLGTGPIQLG